MGCPLWGQEKAPEDHGMGEGQQFCCWRKGGGSPNCWSQRLWQGRSHLFCSLGLLPALSMGSQQLCHPHLSLPPAMVIVALRTLLRS